jgi:hypothetical protein
MANLDGGTNHSRQSTLSPPHDSPDKSSSSPSSISPDPTTDIPEVIRISRSKGARVLEKYCTVNSEGMFFRDATDAAGAVDQAQWQPPANDDTIPRDVRGDQNVVRRLVEALMDTSNAMDTEGNAYRKRFTPGTNVYYDPWTIECCAWHILVS